MVIGNGSTDALQSFSSRYADTVDMYTDPERHAYKALGLLFGMGGMSGLKMLSHGLRAAKSGHRQGKTEGHPLQQGGVFVFDTNGEVRFRHRDETAGDHVDAAQVREVVAQIAAESRLKA